MATIDSISTSLRIADDWQRENQPTRVSKCLSSVLMGYLSLAVSEHDSPTGGLEWMQQYRVTDVLRREWSTLEELAAQVESNQLPSSVIAGNYHTLVFSHLAWCLQEWKLGENFVQFSQRPDVLQLSTKFWREYARGMGCLTRNELYHPVEVRLRGQERFWILYLRFIEAQTTNSSLDVAKADIEKSFAERNKSARIKDDSYQIEGSALHPVRWDYRLHSLSSYIEGAKGGIAT